MQLPAPLIAILLATTLLLPTPANAQNADAAGDNEPPRKIDFTPNPRYTVFDGPMREDGTIDYIAALNAHFSEGVTDENNAFRALYLTLQDTYESEGVRNERLAQLNITEEQIATAPTFIEWTEYAQARGLDYSEASDIEIAAGSEAHFEGQELFQQWLGEQEPFFAYLIEVSKLKKYWCPLVENDKFPGSGYYGIDPGLGHLRRYIRALGYAAMHALVEDDAAKGIEYILAMRRFGSLASHGAFLVNTLVATSLDAMTIDSLQRFLANHQISENEAADLWNGWLDRVPFRSAVETIEVGERSFAINQFLSVSSGLIAFHNVSLRADQSDRLDLAIQTTGIDIPRGTESISNFYQIQSSALKFESFATFTDHMTGLNEAFGLRWNYVLEHYLVEDDSGETHVRVPAQINVLLLTRMLVDLQLCDIGPTFDYIGRDMFIHSARVVVARTGIACEWYRIKHAAYPDELSDLVPEYLAEVPKDPMDGRSLRYRKGPDGAAVIWTIGTDLEDDGGLEDDYDWRDGDYRWRLAPPAAE